jgi:hypothetical protein
MERGLKKYPTLGACGLDCGLCTKHYTVGSSRCPGCCGPDFFKKHPACSAITCCVKRRHLEACGECEEYPCPKFKGAEEHQASETSSYPPYRKILPNLNFVKEHGVEKFIKEQGKRIGLLEKMIEDFDDGRSRSFFCRAAALLELSSLRESLEEAGESMESERVAPADFKGKARILRGLLSEAAIKEGIDLKISARRK